MKESGYWYDTQYDDMFIIYPDGRVDFYDHIIQKWVEASFGYEWMWRELRGRYQFVGEL